MITINVTQEDIDKGTKASCLFCPVAKAIERAFVYDRGRLQLQFSFQTDETPVLPWVKPV